MIGNTPGKAEPIRRYLRILQQDELNQSLARDTVRYGSWLLELTDKDPADVELVAETLEYGRRYAEVLRLVRYQSERSVGAEAAAMRALFWLGHSDLFVQRWETAAAELRENQLMQLYAGAVMAIVACEDESGSAGVLPGGGKSYQSFRKLYATAEPYTPVFLPAQRLAVRVHSAVGNGPAAQQVLKDLEKRQLVTFSDYLPCWELLADAGRVDDALEVSRGFLDRFGNPVSLWLDHGNLLMEHQRWPELKSLAMTVNQSDRLSHLWSTAKYWAGTAELFLDEKEMADGRFAEIADYPILSPSTSLEVVHRLRRFGQNTAAQKVMAQLEEAMGDKPEYWVLRCQIAAADKDLAALKESAEKAYERDPERIENRTNYAVALLLRMMDSVKADPESVIYKLTLIHALIQSDHLEEAQSTLKSLEGMNVATEDLLMDYRLALFELAYAQGRYTDALSFHEVLDLSFLMPEKVAWVETAVTEARKNG